MRLASVILLGVLSATLVGAPLAQAADPIEVLIRKGVDKRRKNDNKGALPYFREAYETSRRARAAAQLGLCEQALEMWLEAEGHLAESLVSQTDAWINAQRGTLEASLQDVRRQLVRVDIEGAPDDASVSIAGVRRGKVEAPRLRDDLDGSGLVPSSRSGASPGCQRVVRADCLRVAGDLLLAMLSGEPILKQIDDDLAALRMFAYIPQEDRHYPRECKCPFGRTIQRGGA